MKKQKEVYFWEWCWKCKNLKMLENESPCDECLSIPAREGSHKPYYYESNEEEN